MDERSDDQAPITRGGQPLEEPPAAEEAAAADRAHEDEIEQGRRQIGTTRGGQPIEDVTG
jgi:hypothetical protein